VQVSHESCNGSKPRERQESNKFANAVLTPRNIIQERYETRRIVLLLWVLLHKHRGAASSCLLTIVSIVSIVSYR
jgi:hypothetical protein